MVKLLIYASLVNKTDVAVTSISCSNPQQNKQIIKSTLEPIKVKQSSTNKCIEYAHALNKLNMLHS